MLMQQNLSTGLILDHAPFISFKHEVNIKLLIVPQYNILHNYIQQNKEQSAYCLAPARKSILTSYVTCIKEMVHISDRLRANFSLFLFLK